MYADRIVHMLDGRITSIEDNRANAARLVANSIATDEIQDESKLEEKNPAVRGEQSRNETWE